MLISMFKSLKRLLDDRPFWLILVGMVSIAATTQFVTDQMSFRAANLKLRPLTGKLLETPSITDFANGSGNIGWANDGTTDESAAFTAAMASGNKTIRVPFSPSCYNLGTTGVSFTSYHWLRGDGRGNPGQGATCFTYSGTGCAVTFDSTVNAGLSDIDVQVNTTSATARGICFKSTTSVAEFNTLENFSVQMVNATPRTTGQIGLDLLDNVNGIFWNVVKGGRFRRWDLSMRLTSSGTTQGVNSNQFYDLMSFSHNTAYQLRAGTKQVTDNRFYGLSCSRSDGALVGATACLMMGDDNVINVFGNSVYGLDNDSGTPDTCGVLGTNAGANYVDAVCESGGGFQDNNTTGAFPNSVCNRLGLGSVTSLCSMGNISTTRGATLTISTAFGLLGGGASGAGAIVQIGGGQTGAASQPGGDLQLFGGSGLGQTNAGGGNVIVHPGARTGTGAGGYVDIGPAPGLSVHSGVRVNSARVTKFSKVFAAVDCAGGSLSVSVSQTLEGSFFTCGTAQNFNTATLQGAGGIVQALAGVPTVGDVFEFTMVSTAAANFTLIASTGMTIVGNPVVNNRAVVVQCRVTSVASNTETATCYL